MVLVWWKDGVCVGYMLYLWNIRVYYCRSWYWGIDDRWEDGRNI